MALNTEVAWMATKDTISITLNGRFRSLKLSTQQGKKLLVAVKRSPQDIDEIAQLADIAMYIAKHSFGRVVIDEQDRMRLDGKIVDYGLTNVLLRALQDGAGFDHLIRFVENVADNPDENVPPNLYAFLEKGNMPITPDGCFHAFKRVDSDYRSFHEGREHVLITYPDGHSEGVTGHIPHPVGGTIWMERADCNPNRDETCSRGLHACSPSYLDKYYSGRGRLIMVKINPKDVTAIPSDYNDAKLRCCRMEIIAEITGSDAENHFNNKGFETRYTPGWQDTVVEPAKDEVFEDEDDEVFEDEDDGDVLLEEAIRLGDEDGADDADEDSKFSCDPTLGDHYDDITDQVLLAYFLSYTESYAENYNLEPYYSAAAHKVGFDDGRDRAAIDKAAANPSFSPFFTEGENFEECSEHHFDTYAKGYVLGYVSYWKGETA